MPQSIAEMVKEEGSLFGSIVSDDAKVRETKKGTPMRIWDVALDDGRTGEWASFGDRGNSQALDSVGQRVEFYENNGFVNIRSAGKKPVSVPVAKEYKKQVEKPDNMTRSVCLSYAKDLAMHGVITVENIDKVAEGFVRFVLSTPSITPDEPDEPEGDDWIDKKTTKYADGREYGEPMIMSATEAQAKELLGGIRPLCTNAEGKADLSLGVDIINGMLCKFYFADEPCSLDIKGEITKESVIAAIRQEDSLTISWFIKELEAK